MNKKRLVVVGGGAAGFFCAVNAARFNPGLEVVILEKGNKLLGKVKVSGGGRCNITHAGEGITEMALNYPRGSAFLKKAFHQFFTGDTVSWFEERGVKLKTEPDGRVFPQSDSSQSVIDCLLREAHRYGVIITNNADVRELKKIETGGNGPVGEFELLLANGTSIYANMVCIAGGGYPKPGQYEWLKQLGLGVEDPVPSLFTFNMPGDPITSLMGISVEDAVLKIKDTKLTAKGPLLITHWGMSGPVVLKLSAWGAGELHEKNYEFNILVNWVPGFNENSLREKMRELRFALASQKMVNRNPFGLPARLWEVLLRGSGIKDDRRWADLPLALQNLLVKQLCAKEFPVRGKTTFKEEFVTAGGIQLAEIDFNTMQSRKVPGLFFAGEVLDVDGLTGGYNFQNAWTTGWIAAKGVGARLAELKGLKEER